MMFTIKYCKTAHAIVESINNKQKHVSLMHIYLIHIQKMHTAKSNRDYVITWNIQMILSDHEI